MTIIKNTHNICKILQSLPITEKVRKVFNDLNISRREVLLGSIARVLNRQFLGYLIANQANKQSTNPNLAPDIYLLSLEELNVLEEVHKLLLKIDEEIFPLNSLLHNAQKSVNPYSDRNYNFINSQPVKFDSEIIGKAVNSLRTQFGNHPSLCLIQDCISNLSGIEAILEEDFVEGVHHYRKEIIRYSLSEIPRNLEVELFNVQEPLQFYRGRLIKSLIVLRDSIFNVNQFFYQAVRYEKPLVLNKENVFDYEGMNQNWLGEVIYLNVQPIGQEVYSKPGDVVVVSLKLEDSLKDGFYRIEQMNGSDSSDFGMSVRFTLREIDENMICYPQLLV